MWREVKKVTPCTACGRPAKRHSIKRKLVYTENGKKELVVSKHYCPVCDKHFTNPDGEKHAPLRRNVSWGIILKALRLAENMTLSDVCQELYMELGYNLSPTTLHDWVVGREQLLKRIPERFLGIPQIGKET